jgi:hypothetical protein
MRRYGWLRVGGMMPALLLVCGCIPASWVSPAPPPTPPRAAPAAGAAAGDGPTLPPPRAAGEGPALPPPVPGPAAKSGAGKPATPPPPGPTPSPELAAALRPVQHEEPSSRQAADLAQRLADTRDESKILAARLQEFQAQIDEKNLALAAAKSEVRRVTEEIKQTREQIDHWTREVGNLRVRAETAEKENQASLKALSQLVEMMIVQETARAGKPPAAPLSAPAAPGKSAP